MITLSLLGRPRVEVDGQPIDSFPTAKALALLLYLALERDVAHPREQLVALLWPDHDDASGRQNLSQTLVRLRRVLGTQADAIDAQRKTVALAADAALQSDIDQFSKLIEATDKHPHTARGSCPHCLPLLAQAVTLVRGELLAGFSVDAGEQFEQWLLLRREQTHETVLAVLADLADGALTSGDWQQAVAYARRQIALEAWRERAYRQLMEALAQDGQRSAALQEYERLRSVLAAELGVEPTAATRRLAESLRSAANAPAPYVAPPAAPRAGNLPGNLTSFVGRGEEVESLLHLYREEQARLIVITGQGGIGKTRLALEVAQRIAAQPGAVPQGVWFVPLDGVAHAVHVPTTIANTLGLALPGQTPDAETVVQLLQARNDLLILDNFETVMDARAWLLTLLRGAPQISIVVTSRERLRLQAECWLALEGLALPPSDAPHTQARDFAASRLFLDRARRLYQRFRLDDVTWPHVMRICRLLDGLPLGIELAVALLESHPIETIADRVATDAGVLATDYLDIAAHQRSIAHVFEASWARLTPAEQTLLASLSVFNAEFNRAAALRVCGGSVRELTTLVRKSLLRLNANDHYALHPLIRQLAQAQLPADHDALHRAHVEYFTQLLMSAVPAEFDKRKHAQIGALLPLMPDLRAAWQWSVHAGDAVLISHLLAPLEKLLRETARLQEGEMLLGAAWEGLNRAWPVATRTPPQTICLARLADCLAFFRLYRGALADVRPLLEFAVNSYGEHHLLAEQARPLSLLNEVAGHLGEHEERLRICQHALALAEAQGDRLTIGRALGNVGTALHHLARLDEARAMQERALAIAQDIEPDYERAITISNLGLTELAAGNLARARALLTESLRIREQYSNAHRIASALRYLGDLALAERDYDGAQAQYTRALALYTAADRRQSVAPVHVGLARAALYRGDFAVAQRHLLAALTLAGERQDVMQAVEALAAWGEWLWLSGQTAQAADVLHYVCQHPNADGLLRCAVGDWIAQHAVPPAPPSADRPWQAMVQAVLVAGTPPLQAA